jgi:hypothetical protein
MALILKEARLIVGEGLRDVAFLENLCRVRNIQGIQFTHCQGTGNMASFFTGHVGWTGFEKLRTLVVMGDNDADAGKSLAHIQAALRGAGLPAPNNPLEIVKRNDKPPITVIQMPFFGEDNRSTGCLETLILSVVEKTYPNNARCVDALYGCSGANGWRSRSSRDKFRLRCILNTLWEENPNSGLKEVLESSRNFIPLDHEDFNPLAEVLTNLGAWFDSGIRSWAEWKEVREVNLD